MKRYLSGSEKRQIKKRREQVVDQQKGALNKFLTDPGHSSHHKSSNNEDEEQRSSTSQQKELVEVESQNIEENNNNEVDKEPANNQPSEKQIENNLEESPLENIETQTQAKNIQSQVTIKDIALWPNILSNEMVEFLILNKPKNIGDITTLKSTYKDGDRIYKRGLCKDHFYRKISGGKKEERKWLIFSETSKSVYCYACKMFSSLKSTLTTGFQDWKNIGITLSQHELSKEHVASMCTLYKRSCMVNRIDVKNLQVILQKENDWREILRRIVSTIKFLASLGIGISRP